MSLSAACWLKGDDSVLRLALSGSRCLCVLLIALSNRDGCALRVACSNRDGCALPSAPTSHYFACAPLFALRSRDCALVVLSCYASALLLPPQSRWACASLNTPTRSALPSRWACALFHVHARRGGDALLESCDIISRTVGRCELCEALFDSGDVTPCSADRTSPRTKPMGAEDAQ